jgi:hypothetical protein
MQKRFATRFNEESAAEANSPSLFLESGAVGNIAASEGRPSDSALVSASRPKTHPFRVALDVEAPLAAGAGISGWAINFQEGIFECQRGAVRSR